MVRPANKIITKVRCHNSNHGSGSSCIYGSLNIQAQNTTTTTSPQASQNQTAAADPQQNKNYLNQAIQAVDSGNNTNALEQVDEAQGLLEADPGALSQWLSSQVSSLAEGENADESGDAGTLTTINKTYTINKHNYLCKVNVKLKAQFPFFIYHSSSGEL